MARQIYINLPVSDLEKSTKFYEALGFVKNPVFSDDKATGLAWSDEIILMILKKEFYKTFLPSKEIADTQKSNAVLIALSMDSKEAVEKFAQTAKDNGGDFYKSGPDMPEDMMFGYEVTDPDGNTWEPTWMNVDFAPHPEA